jgi:penicillin-binding protein 1C
MNATSAALVLDILSDPIARMPGFGSETSLDFPFRAAAKTGTSRHYTDNWAVATTERFTVAVWVGNFSGRPMQKVSGITGAGPLLQRSVLEVAKRYNPGQLMDAERAGLVAMPVCMLSGMRATKDCPSMIEWFTPGTEPLQEDTWQRGGRIALPSEYGEWSAAGARDAATIEVAQGPSKTGSRRILSPLDGDIYEKPPGVEARYATVPLVASASHEMISWTVDGKPIERNRWQISTGPHVIVARWQGGARDSVRVRVE